MLEPPPQPVVDEGGPRGIDAAADVKPLLATTTSVSSWHSNPPPFVATVFCGAICGLLETLLAAVVVVGGTIPTDPEDETITLFPTAVALLEVADKGLLEDEDDEATWFWYTCMEEVCADAG